jgi:hypothetical protein
MHNIQNIIERSKTPNVYLINLGTFSTVLKGVCCLFIWAYLVTCLLDMWGELSFCFSVPVILYTVRNGFEISLLVTLGAGCLLILTCKFSLIMTSAQRP